jgi:hypothetical protein
MEESTYLRPVAAQAVGSTSLIGHPASRGLCPESTVVPDAVREKVKEKEHEMMRGQFRVLPGMSDEDLCSMATLDSNVVSGGP